MLLRARAALLIALVCVSSVARADDPPAKQRARQLLQQGNALFAHSDFLGALALFREAYSVFPSVKLLVNTAACEHALGHEDRAASDLAEFLALEGHAPLSEDNALVERARRDLAELALHLGVLQVDVTSINATIEIDGQRSRPLSYVHPGEHHVLVREPTRGDFDARVQVGVGERVDVHRPEPIATAPVPVAPVTEHRRRWVVPVAVVSSVVVIGLAVGLGLGFGLHRPQPLSGNLGNVPFMP